MAVKKSSVCFFKGQEPTLDAASGIIKGIVILQAGKDKVGDNFDEVALKQLVSLGNAQSQGVKSRFGHPNMCDESLGTYLGRYKNFSVSESQGMKVVMADLYLDDVAKRSPKGNLHDYIVEMASKNDDMFGNSIVYSPGPEEGVQELDDRGQPVNVYYQRFKSFIASDLVDSPAATTSLFKDDSSFASKATDWLDENPDVFELLDKHPEVFKQFITKYSTYKKSKNTMASFKETVKSLLIGAGLRKEKDFDAQTADGKTITVSDPDGDGVAMPGDIVSDDSGAPIANGKIAMADGTTINTDANGAITTIDPKAEAAPAATPAAQPPAPAGKSVEERLTDLEKKYSDEVAARKADNDEAVKTITMLTNRLKSMTSTGEPATSSGTQFRNTKEQKQQLSKEEYKAAMKKGKEPEAAKV